MSPIQILYTVRSNSKPGMMAHACSLREGKLRQGTHHDLESLNYTVSSMTTWAIYQDLVSKTKSNQNKVANTIVCVAFEQVRVGGWGVGKMVGITEEGSVCVFMCARACTRLCMHAHMCVPRR